METVLQEAKLELSLTHNSDLEAIGEWLGLRYE